MALINCPECNKEISNQSEKCIHCGYPLIKNINITEIINGIEYDVSWLINPNMYQGEQIKKLMQMTNCSLNTAADIVWKYNKPKDNRPKCPHCGSTNIKKITMTSKAVHAGIFGFLGAKKILSQYHCNNCKSDF